LNNGYDHVIKSGGSLGVFDLIAFKSCYKEFQRTFDKPAEQVVFMLCVQVKSNRIAEPPERKKIKEFYSLATKERLKKQIWIVYDGNAQMKKPPIRIISYEGDNEFEYFYGFEHHGSEYDRYLKHIF